MEKLSENETRRLNTGAYLLNAKIELSKAINLLDQLYEDGEAELSECGKLYEIKNNLRDYIEEYRAKTNKKEEMR